MRRRRIHCGWIPLYILGLCILLTACAGSVPSGALKSSTSGLSLRPGRTVAVIGISPGEQRLNDGDRADLQGRRVAFGLNNLVAESLFDTGKFRLVEERDVSKRALIEDLVYTYWVGQRKTYSEHELARLAAQLGVETLAYGSVVYSRVSGQSLALGPLSRSQQVLRVQAGVCLYDVSGRVTLCRQGMGKATQEGVGLVYEFRGDRMDFENNAAGKATKQAVAEAVQELMARILFVE